MRCYSRMLAPLQSEHVRTQANVLLATNGRSLSDDVRDKFQRDLDTQAQTTRARAPKASLGFLRQAGFRIER